MGASGHRDSILRSHPKLAGEFHPSLNNEMDIGNITAGSNKKVWWKCSNVSETPCENEWQALVYTRSKGAGCPFCSGRSVHSDGRNSMRTTHLHLVDEFHPTKNGNVTPDNVKAGTNKKLHWICKSCSHEWAVAGSKRAAGSTCPSCANQAVHSDGRNSVRNTHPDLADEFHPTKNGKLSPDNLLSGSNKKILWVCTDCSHEWENDVHHRAIRGQGCPACSGKSLHLDGRNSMRNTRPDLTRDFHPTRNGNHSPDTLLGGTHTELWWLCSDCEHEWQADRRGGRGCPACANSAVHSDGRNSLRTLHPSLSDEFHPTKNGDFTPDKLLAGSNASIHWVCGICSHEWKNRVGKRALLEQGCPACSGKKLHIDGRNSMEKTSPELAQDFHPTKNGEIHPHQILAGTHKKWWWLCVSCENEWEAERRGGQGCPACANVAVHSDGRNSMRNTHPELAMEFHPTKNGDLSPDNLVAGTQRKVTWLCSVCTYDWDATGGNRVGTSVQQGSGCPSCAPTGFDGSKPGYLYCLSYKNALDEWFKVGITNNEVKYRVHQLLLSIQKTKLYFDSEILVLEERFFERGRDAELLERRILQEMKKRNLNFTPQESFQGIRELFIINPFDFAREQDWL